MLNSKKIGIELYEQLGKLFYAMASIDGTVHTKEVDHLRSYVRRYWLDIDAIEDEYGSDAALRIETTFDWCLEYGKKPEACYQEFTEFYKSNEAFFTPKVKRLILDTANGMANAYAKRNKAELILLSRLKMLFLET